MTFDDAMIEAELEDACEALDLDAEQVAYVLASHRASDGGLFRDCMARNCDMQGYAQVRLAIRDGLAGR